MQVEGETADARNVGRLGMPRDVTPASGDAAHFAHPRRTHWVTAVLRAADAVRAWIIPLSIGLIWRAERGMGQTFRLFVLALVVLMITHGVIGWARTRYRLTSTALEVSTGLLWQRTRLLPLASIRSVAERRPWVLGHLGFVELQLHTPSLVGDDLVLGLLTDAEAIRVRTLTVATAGKADGGADVAVDFPTALGMTDDVPPLVTLSRRDLIGAGLTGAALGPGVALLFATGEALLGQFGPESRAQLDATITRLASLSPFALLALGAAAAALVPLLGVWSVWVRHRGFTATMCGDQLILQEGLGEVRRRVVDLHAIHRLSLRQSLPWRWSGYARIAIDAAGDGLWDPDVRRITYLAPIIRRDNADRVLRSVLPAWDDGTLTWTRLGPRAIWLAVAAPIMMIAGLGLMTTFAVSPWIACAMVPLAVTLFPISVRRARAHRWAVSPEYVAADTGWFGARLTIMPLGAIETVHLHAGPVARALGVAKVILDAPGALTTLRLPWMAHADAVGVMRAVSGLNSA